MSTFVVVASEFDWNDRSSAILSFSCYAKGKTSNVRRAATTIGCKVLSFGFAIKLLHRTARRRKYLA